MDRPINAEDVGYGTRVHIAEKAKQRPELIADKFDLPSDVPCNVHKPMPGVIPKSCLQSYWIEEGFLHENKPVKFDRTVTARTNHHAIPREVYENTLSSLRREGQAFKVCTSTPLHNQDDQVMKKEVACSTKITKSATGRFCPAPRQTRKREFLRPQGESRHRSSQLIDEIYGEWKPENAANRMKKKLKTQGSTSKLGTTPKKRGRPRLGAVSIANNKDLVNQGEQSQSPNQKPTKTVETSHAVEPEKVARKRGRPRKIKNVDVPAAEFCTPCNPKISNEFGKTLYKDVLRVEAVGSALPAEGGLGKRGRGRPRKKTATVPDLVCPTNEIDRMETGSNNVRQTIFNTTVSGSA